MSSNLRKYASPRRRVHFRISKNQRPTALAVRLQVLFHRPGERALRHRANHSVHLLTTLEDHHGRDGTNAVLRRHARGFIRVKLDLHAHKNR